MQTQKTLKAQAGQVEIKKRGRPKKETTTGGGFSDPERKVPCPYCGKRFMTERARDPHMKFCKARPQEAPPAAGPEVMPGGPAEGKPLDMPVEVLEIAIASTGDLVAAKAGEYWRLSQPEASSLAKVWKMVLDYYWPQAGPRVLTVALFESALILGPRIGRTIAEQQQRGGGASDGNNNSGPSGERKDNVASPVPGAGPEGALLRSTGSDEPGDNIWIPR